MKTLDTYKEMRAQLLAMEPDVVKCEGGNGAAGTRVRKALQGIKNLAQKMRVQVQEEKNSNK